MSVRTTLMLACATGALAACGGERPDATAQMATSECVPVTEGQFFVVQNGLFVRADTPDPEVIERIVQAPRSWDETLEESFANLGYPWLGLNVRGEVATLTGLAPDAAAKERAFEDGADAIKADPTGGQQISLVVDGISVEGGETGVGAALAELDERPTVESCNETFAKTMAGRNVEFALGSAEISPVSARLLDAVTGVAISCANYNIEVGGHSDTRGSAARNLALSDDRAVAVRAYLIANGVPAEGITAVGYGATQLLSDGNTMEDHARNRRTEFVVTDRPATDD
ncbi:MAG: OmpA family protein [Pseudomonadota bacterium]